MLDYRAFARRAARTYGLDPDAFTRQIQQESSFDPNAVSRMGARGIAQIMPATARSWGVNPDDPRAALLAAAKHMAGYVRQFGSLRNALIAYNAGPGAVGGPLKPETSHYLDVILGSQGGGTSAPSSATPAAGPSYRPVAHTTPGVDNSVARYNLVRTFLFGSHEDPLEFAAQMSRLADVPGKTTLSTVPVGGATEGGGGRVIRNVRTGVPVARETSEGGEHPTEGLAGFPAHDYFAPSGSAAVAPISGTVIRLSGHDPAQGPVEGPHGPLGWSVYIRGADGRTYYLTHLGSRNVRVGQKLRQGQQIGTVADYARYGTPSHIHMGVEG